MTPVETFWTATAPKLAEKWPENFHFIPKEGRIYNEFWVRDGIGVYDDDLSTSKGIALCHDIAEAIGVHVTSTFDVAFSECDGYLLDWTGEWLIHGKSGHNYTDMFPSAPLACLAALNSAVEEVTK